MTGRDRTIVLVAALLVVVVAPWLLVVSPKRTQASKLQSQINAAQSQLTTLRGQAATAEASRRSYATSYTAVVRLGEAVPTDDNTPSLIYQLQSAANAAHVDFDSAIGTATIATSRTIASGHKRLPRRASGTFPATSLAFSVSSLIALGWRRPRVAERCWCSELTRSGRWCSTGRPALPR